MEVAEQDDGDVLIHRTPKKVRVYPRASKPKPKIDDVTPKNTEEVVVVETTSKSRPSRTTRKTTAKDTAEEISVTRIKLETIEEEGTSTNNNAPLVKEIENPAGAKPLFQCCACSRIFKTDRGARAHASSCQISVKKGKSTKAASEADKNLSKAAAVSADSNDDYDTSMFDSDEYDFDNSDDDEDYTASDYVNDSGLRKDIPSEKDIADIIKEIKQFTQVEVEAVEEGLCHCCGEDLATAHTTGEHECTECKKQFKFKSSLERHRRVEHNEGQTYDCPECGSRCPDRGTLARHMYTHTGLKPFTCRFCRKTFSRKYHLVRHNMQTGCDGSEQPTFPCQVCGRVFNRKDNLREHLRAHAGQTKRKKSYTCELCDKEFFGTTLLHIHKRTHTGWERPYECDLCEKRFPSSGAMKKHRRKHTGERPYECNECNAKFSAKETLNRHLRTHNGMKPHSCQFCGKRFIQATQLRAHIFHHSGEHGFKCPHCNKSFNRRTRLSLHIKYVHEGAKPFNCNQCDKTFVRKEDLARHQILHTGVKAHKCPICEKSFAMKSSLKIHLLTHTKEPPRSCDECGRAFIRQDCLLRHMRTKHREMLEEIMVEAEKKKLQQQLISSTDVDLDDVDDPDEPPSILSEETLAQSITELLSLLVDEMTLKAFGWPAASVDHVLESVIKRCGHEPAGYSGMPHCDKLRENAKLLFTVVIDDSVVKTLLNNQTVDEVILHVLRLAKS
ncbi:zinc finger protein 2 isoform X1 [Nilaparvata lugens]|uniref:zinc finger protein 2 isoform X1 n=1 Tax=Nilaparvata lugens TaxID=108931 RepID=UPI00193C8CC0|nr:zinc finger protein 2 isoform X1 [Nilaparvata lugens]